MDDWHPTKIIVETRERKALIEEDRFHELIARCNRQWGDPNAPVTGPELPRVKR
jgi:hypothetical protein